MKNLNWSNVFLNNDVNSATDNFLKNFFTVFDDIFQSESKKNDRNRIKINPWFTKGLMISRKKKLRLYKEYKKKGSLATKNRFNNYRNIYNRLCGEAKKLYYSNELFKVRNNASRRWQLIKEAAGIKNKECDNINGIKSEDGTLLSNPIHIANSFNKYFSSIGEKTKQKVDHTDTDYRKSLPSKANSFVLPPLGPFDIIKLVDQLHDKKSRDINDLSVSLLKDVIYYLADPLAHIFELSLNAGIFPNSFKINKTIPVYKGSGPRDNMSNYRPITIVNCFSKILEKH